MLQQAAPAPWGEKQFHVIVSAVKTNEIVEFAFVYGDPDLSVELVLPLTAFREFCRENRCSVAVPDDRLRNTIRRLISPVRVVAYIRTDETELH
jgi:hypothetical protein